MGMKNIAHVNSCYKQNARDEAAAAVRNLHGAESEVKALQSMSQRMILTQKEMVFNR